MRDVLISLSVMPPNAETTTMAGFAVDSTMLFTLNMLFTVPTDVPPNFNTFMSVLLCRCRAEGEWSSSAFVPMGYKNGK
jgi:hypothetical protein